MMMMVIVMLVMRMVALGVKMSVLLAVLEM
jgi:hypothetical protein